jgi:hypothetical protein
MGVRVDGEFRALYLLSTYVDPVTLLALTCTPFPEGEGLEARSSTQALQTG